MKRLTGERRALAAALLALHAFFYLVLSLVAPEGFGKFLGALSGVYGLGFFALVAGYFWARWYCVGLGLSGVISTAIALWQMGAEPIVMIILAVQGALVLSLWGKSMSELFDGQKAWRERFHLDEHATNRLGNAIIRLGISLPFVVSTLAPKPGSEMLAVGAIALTVLGLRGVITMRTWGLFATAAAGLVMLLDAPALTTHAMSHRFAHLGGSMPVIAGALLTMTVVPFLPSMIAAVRGRHANQARLSA